MKRLKSSPLIFVVEHWTFDETVVNGKWCHILAVKDTKDGHFLGETFTPYLYKLIGGIVWGTLRERSVEGIVLEFELVVCVVYTIER